MADLRRVELDDLLIRPGTYFNPQTEVLLVVDDSPELDPQIFSAHDHDEADWVLISDETPVDEHQRDELLEAFQVRHHPTRGTGGDDEDEETESDEVDELHELHGGDRRREDEPEPDPAHE